VLPSLPSLIARSLSKLGSERSETIRFVLVLVSCLLVVAPWRMVRVWLMHLELADPLECRTIDILNMFNLLTPA
jgi:hypothetical protein